MDLEIPNHLPGMTLKGAVLFPHTLLPLRIFESRYREMLADALAADRMFVVVGENDEAAPGSSATELPLATAGVGLIRQSQLSEDGTSIVILQGIARAQVRSFDDSGIYRVFEIEPVQASATTVPDPEWAACRSAIGKLLRLRAEVGREAPPNFEEAIDRIAEPDIFSDVVSSALCDNTEERQALLETIELGERLGRLRQWAEQEIASIQLYRSQDGEKET